MNAAMERIPSGETGRLPVLDQKKRGDVLSFRIQYKDVPRDSYFSLSDRNNNYVFPLGKKEDGITVKLQLPAIILSTVVQAGILVPGITTYRFVDVKCRRT